MSQGNLNALPAGYRLQWYEIDRVLGQGSFGITYLALDTNLGRKVSVKEFLPLELATRTEHAEVHATRDSDADTYAWGLERFVEEARTLARFTHANIVRVYSVFEANHTAYMVMEYEHGHSLEQAFRAGKWRREDELLWLLHPLLEGLAAIHEAGFIHRDIKPANIFVREDGSPVWLDFGSARHALGLAARTMTSLVTPGYAPFEQYNASKDADKQGPWSDIYSLGATLYRGVVGDPPVDALDRASALLSDLKDSYASVLSRDLPDYSYDFLASIDNALAFRAEDRPQNVEQWRQTLPPRASAGPRRAPPLPAPRSGENVVVLPELTRDYPERTRVHQPLVTATPPGAGPSAGGVASESPDQRWMPSVRGPGALVLSAAAACLVVVALALGLQGIMTGAEQRVDLTPPAEEVIRPARDLAAAAPTLQSPGADSALRASERAAQRAAATVPKPALAARATEQQGADVSPVAIVEARTIDALLPQGGAADTGFVLRAPDPAEEAGAAPDEESAFALAISRNLQHRQLTQADDSDPLRRRAAPATAAQPSALSSVSPGAMSTPAIGDETDPTRPLSTDRLATAIPEVAPSAPSPASPYGIAPRNIGGETDLSSDPEPPEQLAATAPEVAPGALSLASPPGSAHTIGGEADVPDLELPDRIAAPTPEVEPETLSPASPPGIGPQTIGSEKDEPDFESLDKLAAPAAGAASGALSPASPAGIGPQTIGSETDESAPEPRDRFAALAPGGRPGAPPPSAPSPGIAPRTTEVETDVSDAASPNRLVLPEPEHQPPSAAPTRELATRGPPGGETVAAANPALRDAPLAARRGGRSSSERGALGGYRVRSPDHDRPPGPPQMTLPARPSGEAAVVANAERLRAALAEYERADRRNGAPPAPGDVASDGDAPEPGRANAARDERVRTLLGAAEDDLRALRLTLPEGANALARFRKALELDPGNVQAKQGIDRVAEHYATYVRREFERGNFDRSDQLLERAGAVFPRHPRIERLRARWLAMTNSGEPRRTTRGFGSPQRRAASVTAHASDGAVAPANDEVATFAFFPNRIAGACRNVSGAESLHAAREIVSARQYGRFVYPYATAGGASLEPADSYWSRRQGEPVPDLTKLLVAASALDVEGVLLTQYKCIEPASTQLSNWDGRDAYQARTVDVYLVDADRERWYYASAPLHLIDQAMAKVFNAYVDSRS